ncbi:MAG: hypothetical protein KGS48_09150 [Bacteroidetes bacterium]|nr:hypothetical protein [Bacteroidota bacterium]
MSRLINGEIQHTSSWGNEENLFSPNKSYDNLLIFVSVEDGKCYKLLICSLFFYNENIDDEVTTLDMRVEEDNNRISQFPEATPSTKQAFKICKIKIYGEERLRIWSEAKKMNYFHKKSDIEVSDYYFNNTIIRLESADEKFINIFAHRSWLNSSFDKDLNLAHDLYMSLTLTWRKILWTIVYGQMFKG